MVKVKFLVDFASKKQGDVFECDASLASTLINNDKVAELVKEELKTETPDYSKLSIEEVKEELKKRGLAFAHNSKLETLVAILQKNDFEKA